MQTKKNNLLSHFHMQIESELLRLRIYFAISVVLEKIRGSWKKFHHLSAGSLLNTPNKCLDSIRGALSRSGGSKMDQFWPFFFFWKLFAKSFFPPLPQNKCNDSVFSRLQKIKPGKEPALVYRPLIINPKA